MVLCVSDRSTAHTEYRIFDCIWNFGYTTFVKPCDNARHFVKTLALLQKPCESPWTLVQTLWKRYLFHKNPVERLGFAHQLFCSTRLHIGLFLMPLNHGEDHVVHLLRSFTITIVYWYLLSFTNNTLLRW